MGIPGSISPYTPGGKKNQLDLAQRPPFDKDLSLRLEREVRLANDANCLAVSEAVDGAAAGAQTVFAVIIGTAAAPGGVASTGGRISAAMVTLANGT